MWNSRAEFCPGHDCPVALSPGPRPDSGDSRDRDRDPDIIQRQPPIPGGRPRTSVNFFLYIKSVDLKSRPTLQT